MHWLIEKNFDIFVRHDASINHITLLATNMICIIANVCKNHAQAVQHTIFRSNTYELVWLKVLVLLRYIEVGAIHYSNISTAISHTGHVFAWGLCKGQSVMVPTETHFQDINEVFASLSTPAVTCKPLILCKFHHHHIYKQSNKLGASSYNYSKKTLAQKKEIFLNFKLKKIKNTFPRVYIECLCYDVQHSFLSF